MRPDYLLDSPANDRGDFNGLNHHKYFPRVYDFGCGRGGVGRALNKLYFRDNWMGFDIEPEYGESYPGQFIQCDLYREDGDGVTRMDAPVDREAHLCWISFPCQAYAGPTPIETGSREAALEEYYRISEDVRKFAKEHGIHYIIENVPGAARVGDLKANVRMNGLAFGLPFDQTHVFETSFQCPDAYEAGTPDIVTDLRQNQSEADLAEAKGVPKEWSKSEIRSAIPHEYVYWLFHHCPSVPAPKPERKQYVFAEGTDPHEQVPHGNL